MNQPVFLPTTKEEALAAGVPEELFDPKLHLFSVTVQTLKPGVRADATPPQEKDDAKPKSN